MLACNIKPGRRHKTALKAGKEEDKGQVRRLKWPQVRADL